MVHFKAWVLGHGSGTSVCCNCFKFFFKWYRSDYMPILQFYCLCVALMTCDVLAWVVNIVPYLCLALRTAIDIMQFRDELVFDQTKNMYSPSISADSYTSAQNIVHTAQNKVPYFQLIHTSWSGVEKANDVWVFDSAQCRLILWNVYLKKYPKHIYKAKCISPGGTI